MKRARLCIFVILSLIAVMVFVTACSDKGGGADPNANDNVADTGADTNEKYSDIYNYSLKILSAYEHSRIIAIPAETDYLTEIDMGVVNGLTELIYAFIPASSDSDTSVLKTKVLFFSNDATAKAYFDEPDSVSKFLLGNKVFLNFPDNVRLQIDAALPITVPENVKNYTKVLLDNDFYVILSEDPVIAPTDCAFMLGGGKSANGLGSIINQTSISESADLSYNIAVNFYSDNASALAALGLFGELTFDEGKNAYFDEDAPNGMDKIYFKVVDNIFFQCRYNVYNALINGGSITSPELEGFTEIFADYENKEIDHIGLEDFKDTYYWGDSLYNYPFTLLLYFKDKTFYRLKYVPIRCVEIASSAAEWSDEDILYPPIIRPDFPSLVFTPILLGNGISYSGFNSEPLTDQYEGVITFYYNDYTVDANYTIISDIVDYEIKGLRTEYLPNESLLLYWQDIELSYTLHSGKTETIKPSEYDTYNFMDALRPTPDLQKNISLKIYQDDSELFGILPSSGNFKIEIYLRGKTITVDCRINPTLQANFNFAMDIWQYDDVQTLKEYYYNYPITINFSDNTKGAFVLRDNFSFEPDTSLAGNHNTRAVYNDFAFDLNYIIKPQDAAVKDFEFREYGNNSHVDKYKGTNQNVIIPSTYRGKKVNSINGDMFRDCDTTILSLFIPESVIEITSLSLSYRLFSFALLKNIIVDDGNSVYSSENGILLDKSKTKVLRVPSGMSGTIPLPNGVKTIEAYAFADCVNLSSITIPNSVTSIGNSAFSGCSGLTSVTIPDSVTSIGNSAFSGCSGLTSVTIPDSVTSIGDRAFYNCGLTTIMIPESVLTIGSHAFAFNDYLLSSTLPNNLKTIPDGMFYYCYNLMSVTLPTALENIGSDAFHSCRSLYRINLPATLRTIGNRAFASCSGLREINLPAALETIGNNAFSSCSSLTSLIIPDGLKVIGNSAFSGCEKLKNIEIPNSVISISGFAFDFDETIVIYCEQTSKPDNWSSDWNSYKHYYSYVSGPGTITVSNQYEICQHEVVWGGKQPDTQ